MATNTSHDGRSASRCFLIVRPDIDVRSRAQCVAQAHKQQCLLARSSAGFCETSTVLQRRSVVSLQQWRDDYISTLLTNDYPLADYPRHTTAGENASTSLSRDNETCDGLSSLGRNAEVGGCAGKCPLSRPQRDASFAAGVQISSHATQTDQCVTGWDFFVAALSKSSTFRMHCTPKHPPRAVTTPHEPNLQPFKASPRDDISIQGQESRE